MNDALMTAVNRCISRLAMRGWSVPSEREPGVLHVHAAAPRTKSRCYIHIAERDQPDLVTLAVGEGLLNDERDLRIARAVATKLLIYGCGRPVTAADRDSVNRVLESSRADNFGLRAMIHAVVDSPLFLEP